MSRLLAVLLLLLGTPVARPARGSEVETISLGSGPSMVVEYDRELTPVRRYTGLYRPHDITPRPDGSLIVVDAGREVIELERDGSVRWRGAVGFWPARARPLPDGGLLVSSGDELVALDAARSPVWTRTLVNLRIGVPLASGGVLTANNDRQGWLTEWSPAGEMLWRSAPRGYTDSSGRWIDEERSRTFSSLSSLDVGPDGTVFTTDYDQHDLRLLQGRETVRVWAVPGAGHFTDTRIGPRGELIATSAEAEVVWVKRPDGSEFELEPELRPWCANLNEAGHLLVGLEWLPENSRMNATELAARPKALDPWYRRPRMAGLGLAIGLALALLGRGRRLRSALRRRLDALRGRAAIDPSPGDEARDTAGTTEPPAPASAGPSRARRLAIGIAVLAVAIGAWWAWRSLPALVAQGGAAWWRFAAGSAIAGAGLLIANRLLGRRGTLTSLRAGLAEQTAEPGLDRPGHWLLGGALVSLAAAMALLLFAPAEQALAIGFWIVAQLSWLASSWQPENATAVERPRWGVALVLSMLVAAAIVTRFSSIGELPDHLHQDHGIIGHAAIETARGGWKPFFVMDQLTHSTIARPWMLTMVAGFELFGRDYWVLRLTGAISGVALVLVAYAMGQAFFNRRVGLIAAFLALINSVLWIYSRQPYVLDSAPFFLLALTACAIGLRRGGRLMWSLAGMLSGWSMLTVRSFTIFPIIGAALLVYCAVVHPRWLFRRRVGLLWFLGGAAIVYLPMVPGMLAESVLGGRLDDSMVLIGPDGSWRPAEVWHYQIGRSFGAILRYADTSPWGVTTARPILLGAEAVLFGVGLVYLAASWGTPATAILSFTILIALLLGSAILPSPPTHYHFLFAIVPLQLIAAVGLDRAIALCDGWRSRVARVMPVVLALAMMTAIARDHWRAIEKYVTPQVVDGHRVHRADARSMAARAVREDPDYRWYLVRTRAELSSVDVYFDFFADDSDLSDLSTPLKTSLPVPPVGAARGAAFLVLPGRSAEAGAITDVYPDARRRETRFTGGQIAVYYVEKESIDAAYRSHQASAGGERPAS